MPDRICDVYPLTPLQQGMLFHSLSEQTAGMYCEQVVSEVQGGLHTVRLRTALGHLLARHAALRTAFVWQEVDDPVQVVLDDAPIPIEEHDCNGVDAAGTAEALETLLDEQRRRGFDLGSPPLVRADLVRCGTCDLLVLTFHHLILDGWSLSIVMRDLVAIYKGLEQGEPPALKKPPLFRDFLHWLRRLEPAPGEDFHAGELEGFAAPTPVIDSLQSRGERSAAASHGEETVHLPAESTAALRKAAQTCGVTLSTLVQGAWAIALSRITGEDDVVFGIVVSGRPPSLPGVESMVGMFINTVPLRVRMNHARRVDAFLKDLQKHNARLREHEQVPLARIQAGMNLPGGQALFESVVVFENYPAEVERTLRELTEGRWTARVRSLQLTNYPLHLMVIPGDELLLDLTFELGSVGRRTAARLLTALGDLLSMMARRPRASLAELSLHARPGRRRAGGRGPARALPAGSFRQQFEEACTSYPDRTAVRDGVRAWSYSELAARARTGAARLVAAGAGPEVVVGLVGPRNSEFLCSILAVLGAEAAFLPLEARDPVTRQADALERSGARILVGGLEQAAALVNGPARKSEIVHVDMLRLCAPESGQVSRRPLVSTGPEQLAYVIFTSGSSGLPKGAMIVQRGLMNHLHAKIDALNLSAGDVVAQTAPVCFDISVWQFLAPLLVGGTVHIVPDDIAFDGTRLLADAGRAGINVLELVPSLLGAVLDDVDSQPDAVPGLDGLRCLLSTGEALSAGLCRRWLTRFPTIPVLNAYGPTECSDDVAHHVVASIPTDGGLVPIGRPLANTDLYVMDHVGRELPSGFVGELYVGGAGVGRGYVADEGSAARAFVEVARCDDRTERLYRTGDRVRQRADGVFEYIGREDDQLKLRGYRIEPGEIERRLLEHGAVESAVAVAAPFGGVRQLVAFVVERDATTDADLRGFLRVRLPEYMVPAAFVRRTSIPLGRNGKVDRRALSASLKDQAAWRPRETTAEPRDAVEAKLREIWAAVLNRSVGVDQNFFELGGDSILVMQVVSRANQAGLVLTVRQMFEHQTIEGIAQVVRAADDMAPNASVFDGPVPLTPIQKWFFELRVPNRNHWNMSLRVLVRERLQLPLLETAVRAVVEHHEALRLGFAGGVFSRRAEGQDCSCEVSSANVSRVSRSAGDEGARDHEGRLQRSLHLERGPLLRVALVDTGGPGASELVIVVHHLVADAVSLRVLLEDIEDAYLALREGRPAQLPPVATSAGEWARHLEACAESEETRAEWAYWCGVGIRNRALLPVQGQASGNVEGGMRVHESHIGAEETEALIRVLPGRGVAVQDVLLAALAEAMSQHVTDGELVVDVEGHGRHWESERFDLSRTVGWLAVACPLALGDAGKVGITERHAAVREARERVPRDGVGYGILRYVRREPELAEQLEAVTSRQVSFNYFGQVDALLLQSTLFASVREGYGPDHDPRATRPYVLEVVGGVFDGRLRLLFRYVPEVLKPETVASLADAFVVELRAALAAGTRLRGRLHESSSAQSGNASPIPVTLAQRGLWFLEQFRPGTPVSNSAVAFRVRGPFRDEIAQRALDAIVQRHEPLRFRVLSARGEPSIVDVDDTRVTIALEDWSREKNDADTAAIQRWMRSVARRPFDLSVDAPLRVALLRLAPDDCVLVVTAHHIAVDGWSFGVLGRELMAMYSALGSGVSPTLPDLPVRYSDFARHQQERLRGPRLERLLGYWRRQLDGAPPLHDLPTDRPRPPTPTFDGGSVRRALSGDLSESVRSYAAARGTTMFVALLTAFALALAKRSASKDIVVGANVSGRRSPEHDALIGVFVNTVVLRIDLSGVSTYGGALARTAETSLAALEHDELPFELLVENLRPVVQGSHAPIAQIGFAMQNMPLPEIEGNGLEFTPLDIDTGVTRTDLSLFASDEAGGVRMTLEYSRSLFDAATAEALSSDIERQLVEGVAGDDLVGAEVKELSDVEVDARLRQLVDPS